MENLKLFARNLIETTKTIFDYFCLIIAVIFILFFIFYFLPAFGGFWNDADTNMLPKKYDPRTDTWVDDMESPFWPRAPY